MRYIAKPLRTSQAACDKHAPDATHSHRPPPQITYQTSHGQLLDLTTAPIGSVDLSKYTLENYMLIVTYKTAYYSFYMPVACGMLLAGIKDPEAFKVAEKILVEMGQYFQVRRAGPWAQG